MAEWHIEFTLSVCVCVCVCVSGLEKLTNANRSVCTGNDRLFPVKLTEIADWTSMSEYMLHSNFGKKMTRVIGGSFGVYTFILPLPYFLTICLRFLGVLSTERILKQNKTSSEFPRTNSGRFRPLEWFCSKFSQRSSAKCRGQIILL